MRLTSSFERHDLDDPADVGAVRRRVVIRARDLGLDEARANDAAIVASELASNVLKHAGRGGALSGAIEVGDQRGVAIVAWDRGPGMALDACLRDGMSTSGTAGNGLGAVSRLATRWDAYAPIGGGTVVVALILPPPSRREPRPAFAVDIGAVSVPIAGEQACGDAWEAHVRGAVTTTVVADGLGHGPEAAKAAAAVLAAVRDRPDDDLGPLIERAHRAAGGTRGAAATIARIDRDAGELSVAAVGNVTPWLVTDGQRQLVTQHGTLGHALPTVRVERYRFPAGATLLLCSDGLKSRWALADLPGLAARSPALIAAVLWRDLQRGRDDATVVVVRPETRPEARR